jgi:hypothetical protein
LLKNDKTYTLQGYRALENITCIALSSALNFL